MGKHKGKELILFAGHLSTLRQKS